MKVYIGAYTGLFLLLIYFALAWAGVVPRPRPAASAPQVAQAVVLGLALLLSGAALALAARWSAAPRRAWFWPLAAVPPVLFFAPDLPEFASLVTQPPSLLVFAFALLAVLSLPALVIGAALATLQARAAAADANDARGSTS